MSLEVTESSGGLVEVLDETNGTTLEVAVTGGTTLEVATEVIGVPGRPGVIVIDADQDLPPDGTPAGVVVYRYTS